MGPCPFARLGTPTLGGFRFPNLKDAAETHEHHGLAKSSIADEVIGQEYSTFLVGFDRKRNRLLIPSTEGDWLEAWTLPPMDPPATKTAREGKTEVARF